MNTSKEYIALRIFEGSDFPGAGSFVTKSWYTRQFEQNNIDATELEEIIKDFISRELIIYNEQHEQIRLDKKGIDLYDKTYYQEQAYDMIDEALERIKEHNGGIDVEHKRYQRITKIVHEIIDKYYLIEFFSNSNRNISVAEIKNTGYSVLDAGGIRNFLQRAAPPQNVLLKNMSTKQILIERGEFFDAFNIFRDIIHEAKKSILLIDNYVDEITLRLFTEKNSAVELKIITSKKCYKTALTNAAEQYNRQYQNLKIGLSEHFHDRFLIVDDTLFYHIGASVKDAGSKVFMIAQIEEPEVIQTMLQKVRTEWNKQWP